MWHSDSLLNKTVYVAWANRCRDMNLDLRAGYGIRSMPTTINHNPKTSFSKPSLFRSSASISSAISFSERSGVY